MTTRRKTTAPIYTAPFRFLSLPPEIRTIIYKHVAAVSSRNGIIAFDEELRLLDSLGVHNTNQFESKYRRVWSDTPFVEVVRSASEVFVLAHRVGAEFMAENSKSVQLRRTFMARHVTFLERWDSAAVLQRACSEARSGV